MKVSYKQLQTYFDDTLPEVSVLADALVFHFAEVEEVVEVEGDHILNVKVLPDRAGYAKSYEGVALEVSAILGLKRKASMIPAIEYVRKIEVNPADIRRVLGVEISDQEIISILKKLDLKVIDVGHQLTLSIPSNRTDLNDWRDIVEEVARLHGYDKIPAKIPEPLKTTRVEKAFYYAEKIKNILAEMGFSEIYGYSLTDTGVFHIEKSVAQDKNYLRANLTDGLAKSLELNAKNADLLGLDSINIFEIGNVFCEEGEHTALAIGIMNAGKKEKGKKERSNDRIKNVRDEVFKALNIEAQILCMVDDSGGIISLNGKTIGITNSVEGVMELNLNELIKSLPEPTSYADLNFSKTPSITYKKFSVYPFMVRDIAVFVPESVDANEVWSIIEKGITESGGSHLLVRKELFDTFKKEGKVSYAFRMIYQALDKTLTDVEANNIMEKVNAEIKGKGWEVR